MSIGQLLCAAALRLHAQSIPRREARLLLAHALATTPEALLRDAHAPVPPEAAANFETLLARRLAHEPMAFILGRTGFWTLDLEVSPDTLIPRADSEAVIELALRLATPAARILDLGTGTGCLLLALLSEWPHARGLGVDLSPAAAALAARNASRNGLASRARFLAGHWGEALDARFDLILSNPPYIESAGIAGLMPEVRHHEPTRALDGGPDGLDAYRALLVDLPRLLAPGGLAVLEFGQGQGPAIAAMAKSEGLELRGFQADLSGIERAIALNAFSAGTIGAGRESA